MTAPLPLLLALAVLVLPDGFAAGASYENSAAVQPETTTHTHREMKYLWKLPR